MVQPAARPRSAPSRRRSSARRPAWSRRSAVTTSPQPVRCRARAHEQHEEQQRPGRMTGDVHRPVVGPQTGSGRCTRAGSCERSVTCERCRGTRTRVEDGADAVPPSTVARLTSSQRDCRASRRSSSRAPGKRPAQSRPAYATPRTPTGTARGACRVPAAASTGRCSGGKQKTCTFQSSDGGDDHRSVTSGERGDQAEPTARRPRLRRWRRPHERDDGLVTDMPSSRIRAAFDDRWRPESARRHSSVRLGRPCGVASFSSVEACRPRAISCCPAATRKPPFPVVLARGPARAVT